MFNLFDEWYDLDYLFQLKVIIFKGSNQYLDVFKISFFF